MSVLCERRNGPAQRYAPNMFATVESRSAINAQLDQILETVFIAHPDKLASLFVFFGLQSKTLAHQPQFRFLIFN